jgi:hypothetical protein
MAGSSGFILHLALALLASIEMGAAARGTTSLVVAACVVTATIAGILFANGRNAKAHPLAVTAVALPFGAFLGLLPMALRLALPRVIPVLDWELGVLVVHAFVGAFALGVFFVVLALLGLEHQQAFAVLSHPGFKHFVRICVRPDGRVEAWTVGKDDPVAAGEPALVDRFDW